MRKKRLLYEKLFMFTSQVYSSDEKLYLELVEELKKQDLINTFKNEFKDLSDYDDVHNNEELQRIFKELKCFKSSNKNDDYTFLLRLVVHMYAINEMTKEEE